MYLYIIVAQWCHVATLIWESIGSGKGLLQEGTKPLPETMLNYRQRSLPDLPGAGELNVFVFTNIVLPIMRSSCTCMLWSNDEDK